GKASKGVKAALAAAGVLAFGLLLGPRVAMAWMLVQQENANQQEILQVYQHHFPSMRQQTNIKYHFGQNMKKQSKGVFLQLEDLEKARQAVPALEITLLEYDAQQNTLTLSASSQNQSALQTFVNQAGEYFYFTLQPVSTSAPYTAMIAGKYK
ncbi:GspL/Epsl periplasmic domain-containing protein, partial [Enterobacter chuandaensis]|uniref:GspL/Epsl periplasmic domain-containing protein n=1 Tax=Enterobacter chuandaensis TaxID=2497875 RepID=UPI0027E3D7DA